MLSASVRDDIHVYWLGQLIDATKAHCREKGIAQLYVHVVPSNEAAVKLYLANGFVQETEEKADFAYLRDRERRLLLRFDVDGVTPAPASVPAYEPPATPEPEPAAAATSTGNWEGYSPSGIARGQWQEVPDASAPIPADPSTATVGAGST